jgi:hypothetical protein
LTSNERERRNVMTDRVILGLATSFLLLAVPLLNSCSRNNATSEGPTAPGMADLERRAMDFGGSQTIFGTELLPAADVDMSTIPWPYDLLDDVDWTVAVAIEDPPDGCRRQPKRERACRRSDTALGPNFPLGISRSADFPVRMSVHLYHAD